jgi:hypothetical protein
MTEEESQEGSGDRRVEERKIKHSKMLRAGKYP